MVKLQGDYAAPLLLLGLIAGLILAQSLQLANAEDSTVLTTRRFKLHLFAAAIQISALFFAKSAAACSDAFGPSSSLPYGQSSEQLDQQAKALLKSFEQKTEIGVKVAWRSKVALGLLQSNPSEAPNLKLYRQDVDAEVTYRRALLKRLISMNSDDPEVITELAAQILLTPQLTSFEKGRMLISFLQFLRQDIGEHYVRSGKTFALLQGISELFLTGSTLSNDDSRDTPYIVELIIAQTSAMRGRSYGNDRMTDLQDLLTELGYWRSLAQNRTTVFGDLVKALNYSIEELEEELKAQIKIEKAKLRAPSRSL